MLVHQDVELELTVLVGARVSKGLGSATKALSNGLATDTIRILVCRAYRAVFSCAWGRFSNLPRISHLRKLRQVRNPVLHSLRTD